MSEYHPRDEADAREVAHLEGVKEYRYHTHLEITVRCRGRDSEEARAEGMSLVSLLMEELLENEVVRSASSVDPSVHLVDVHKDLVLVWRGRDSP